MNTSIVPLLIFMVGCIAGSFGFIASKFTRQHYFTLAGCAFTAFGISALVFGRGMLDSGVNMFDLSVLTILVFVVVYLAAFAVAFRDIILPEINELVLIGITTIAGCLLYISHAPLFLWVAFLLPTYVVMLLGLFPVILTSGLRVFLYSWYLFLLIALCVYGANFQVFLPVFGGNAVSTQGKLYSFLAGGLFSYLFVHASYLLALLPIRGKHESLYEYRMRRAAHLAEFKLKFSPHQQHALSGLVVIAGIILLFWIRDMYGYPSVPFLVTFSLVLVSVMTETVGKFVATVTEYRNTQGETIESEHKNLFSAKAVLALPLSFVVTLVVIVGLINPAWIKVEAGKLFLWHTHSLYTYEVQVGRVANEVYAGTATNGRCVHFWSSGNIPELKVCGANLTAEVNSEDTRAVGFYWLGVAADLEDNVNLAEEYLLESLRINPNDESTNVRLAAVYLNRDRTLEGCKYAQIGVSLDQNYSWAHSVLGQCYFMLGDKQKAIDEFNQAIVLDPGIQLFKDNLEIVKNNLP